MKTSGWQSGTRAVFIFAASAHCAVSRHGLPVGTTRWFSHAESAAVHEVALAAVNGNLEAFRLLIRFHSEAGGLNALPASELGLGSRVLVLSSDSSFLAARRSSLASVDPVLFLDVQQMAEWGSDSVGIMVRVWCGVRCGKGVWVAVLRSNRGFVVSSTTLLWRN